MSNALFFMAMRTISHRAIDAKGTLPKQGLWNTAHDMEVE